MRGRKPTPTALRILRGNPGKRRINADEPQPPAALASPPDSLQGEALDEWKRRGPQLIDLGVLTVLDSPAFLAYCRSWGRYVDAEEKLRTDGEVIRAPSGYPIPNPYRAVANRALAQCQQFWSEFGMMPSSRSRIGAKPHSSKTSDAARRREKFFGGLSRRA